MAPDPFAARSTLSTPFGETVTYYRLEALEEQGIANLDTLPFTVRILLENTLRHAGGEFVDTEIVKTLARWEPRPTGEGPAMELPFLPGRVVLQDFTGVPAVVDLAAMRDAVANLGGDVTRINPLVPADLVIDHSVQVDRFGTRWRSPRMSISSTSEIASATNCCAGRSNRSRTSGSSLQGLGSSTRSISNTWRRWS